MKREKTIYEQPRRYAKVCKIPIKYARLICKSQLKIQRDIRKNSRCPFGGKRELSIDWDDREYHCNAWAYCNNCGDTFDFDEYPKIRVPSIGEDFDVVLWFSHDKDNEFKTEKEWIEFVKKEATMWLKQ